MRRGIGVARIQNERQMQQQMADFGAQITAERIGKIADQLEALEKQLGELAHKHKHEIKRDPVVRARFRQLADSLGVDLISSKKNIFAGILGLGDFYYDLSSKVVGVCMKERKFCGSYVPLQKIIQAVQRVYDNTSVAGAREHGKERITLSEDDIVTALDKLHHLGSGYNIVSFSGVKYVQTTPDGVRGSDEVALLNFALEHQKSQIARYAKDKQPAPHGVPLSFSAASPPSAVTSLSVPAMRIGAAYVLGTHPLIQEKSNFREDVPLIVQCVALTQQQVIEGLYWPQHRAHATLERAIQDGSVWVDYPKESANSAGPSAVKALSSTEVKEVWHKERRVSPEKPLEKTIYWFISLAMRVSESD